jgi:hypothetical protein
MRAASSAVTPYEGQPSSTHSARFVFATDAATVSMSRGRSERRSTTSADTPFSDSSRSATCSARTVANECDTIVMSVPSRATAARPIGTTCSGSSGTSPFSL